MEYAIPHAAGSNTPGGLGLLLATPRGADLPRHSRLSVTFYELRYQPSIYWSDLTALRAACNRLSSPPPKSARVSCQLRSVTSTSVVFAQSRTTEAAPPQAPPVTACALHPPRRICVGCYLLRRRPSTQVTPGASFDFLAGGVAITF